jgi:MarR family transcriptional regulator, 2-MHQ and catechol-resistance regulon repressor
MKGIMGTHYKGTRNEIRAIDAYIKLQRSAESSSSRATRHLISAGLTFSQYGVLDILYHLGPLPLGQIAEKILKSEGNMTTVVDNLERRGLVRRERNERDRRVITLSLTAAGQQIIEEVLPQHIQAILEEMSILTADEQEILSRLCRKIGKQEERARDQQALIGELKE